MSSAWASANIWHSSTCLFYFFILSCSEPLIGPHVVKYLLIVSCVTIVSHLQFISQKHVIHIIETNEVGGNRIPEKTQDVYLIQK